MIQISADAKKYWTELLESSGQKYVRLSLKGGGCAGFAYTWDYTEDDSNGTLVDNIIVVDDVCTDIMSGSMINFVTSMTGSEIQITNPNEASSCGCGESIQFSV
jgi:iron-sulfur cluster assembly accessory protein